jgi:CDP-diacylglycerol--serine O-phosphatidyltransferase
VKKIAILPTLLTLGNAVCGFAAIAYASKIKLVGPDPVPEADVGFYFTLSAWLILGAMAFDALDGYVARLSKTASEFGGQLDSLCDAISFGAAPAFLLLRLGQEWGSPPAVAAQAISVVAALYMVCAILRLARFNIENSPDPAYHKRFKGLPSPAAAGCVASLALLRSGVTARLLGVPDERIHNFVALWAPPGTLLVALLMVSRFPYAHVTKHLMRRGRHFRFVVQAVLVVFAVALLQDLALFLVFWAYALQAPVRYLLARGLRNGTLPAHSPGLD